MKSKSVKESDIEKSLKKIRKEESEATSRAKEYLPTFLKNLFDKDTISKGDVVNKKSWCTQGNLSDIGQYLHDTVLKDFEVYYYDIDQKTAYFYYSNNQKIGKYFAMHIEDYPFGGHDISISVVDRNEIIQKSAKVFDMDDFLNGKNRLDVSYYEQAIKTAQSNIDKNKEALIASQEHDYRLDCTEENEADVCENEREGYETIGGLSLKWTPDDWSLDNSEIAELKKWIKAHDKKHMYDKALSGAIGVGNYEVSICYTSLGKLASVACTKCRKKWQNKDNAYDKYAHLLSNL